MMRDSDLAIAVYTRAVTAKFSLQDARKVALDAVMPAYLPAIEEALCCIDRLMLECAGGNPGLSALSPLVNKLVTEYASREGNEPSDYRK
jgi:hypothetical protein